MSVNFSRLRWLCRLGMICIAFGPMLIPVYLTTYSAAFGGLSTVQLGQIPAALFAAAMAGILLTGALADRTSPRLFAVAGAALASVGLLLISQAGSYVALLGASALLGCGVGILDSMMSPIIAVISGPKRSSELNALHAFYSVGAVSATGLASLGISMGISWRVVISCLALLPALIALGFAMEPLPALVHPDAERQRLRHLLRMPRFYAALLAIALAGATEEGMAQWLPAYAERVLGYEKHIAGFGLTAYAVLMGIGRFAGIGIVQKLGTHRLVMGSAIFCAGLYLLGSLAPWPAVAFAACIGVGFAGSILWPTVLGMTADRMPHGGATLFAMLSTFGTIGNLSAPWIEGGIAEQAGLRVALTCGVVWPFMLAVVAAVLWRVDRGGGMKK
jgi:fucose permease